MIFSIDVLRQIFSPTRRKQADDRARLLSGKLIVSSQYGVNILLSEKAPAVPDQLLAIIVDGNAALDFHFASRPDVVPSPRYLLISAQSWHIRYDLRDKDWFASHWDWLGNTVPFEPTAAELIKLFSKIRDHYDVWYGNSMIGSRGTRPLSPFALKEASNA